MSNIAVVQFSSLGTVDENLKQAKGYIEEAVNNQAKCIVFPEEFITLGMTPAQKLAIAEPYQNGPLQSTLSGWAKEYDIWIIGGTLPIQSDNPSKFYSSCIVWDNVGNTVKRYDKIHLFDVTVSGGEAYCESNHVQSGKDIAIVATPFGKIGIAICYDLRFPELFRYFSLKGVDMIVLPSAFTQPTGKAHWEVLLRARAIESLCYVIAPNQVGIRLSGHGTYGHSMIISPWGEILCSLEDKPGIIVADLDLDKMDSIRERFPALKHYQPFIFKKLIDLVKEDQE
jgi:deaminated glutathione amidase